MATKRGREIAAKMKKKGDEKSSGDKRDLPSWMGKGKYEKQA